MSSWWYLKRQINLLAWEKEIYIPRHAPKQRGSRWKRHSFLLYFFFPFSLLHHNLRNQNFAANVTSPTLCYVSGHHIVTASHCHGLHDSAVYSKGKWNSGLKTRRIVRNIERAHIIPRSFRKMPTCRDHLSVYGDMITSTEMPCTRDIYFRNGTSMLSADTR